MLIVRSRNGVPVRLTEERWRHIVDRHPEMDGQREKVLETLAGRLYLDGVPVSQAVVQKGDVMEAVVKILEKPAEVSWDYDEEADVLYLSVGEPKSAIGVDLGEGVIARYDEKHKELVGVTLIGLRARLLRELDQKR